MRRLGFMLMAMAVILVIAGLVLRARSKSEPPEAGVANAPAAVSAAPEAGAGACQATAALLVELAAMAADIDRAMEQRSDAALAVAVVRAVARRDAVREAFERLAVPLPVEYRGDARDTARNVDDLLATLGRVDLTDPDAETTERIQRVVTDFQTDPDARATSRRLNSYLASCPGLPAPAD